MTYLAVILISYSYKKNYISTFLESMQSSGKMDREVCRPPETMFFFKKLRTLTG